MVKRVLIALTFFALGLPLLSQSDYEYIVTYPKANRIVLLGEWKDKDIGEWKQVIDSDSIYGHAFTLLERRRLTGPLGHTLLDAQSFEDWFRQRYGLSLRARWAALGMEDTLIASGTQRPNAKEFEQMLDSRGLKSMVRRVRDFLRENPDHIDAMTDLLVEVRRRALRLMPPDTTKDLDTETDLRIWAVMAAEVDKVFKGSWLGIDPVFFRPDQQQPERFSKLMRGAFSKHISKVEAALRLEPTNETLWNIWAWMARSMPDYKWELFINSMGTFSFPSIYLHSPSEDVCVWLATEALAKGKWETVIEFAKIAQYCTFARSGEVKTKSEWVPRGGFTIMGIDGGRIPDYPVTSSFLPRIEALLRLGRIDEANELYDEMLRNKFIGLDESKSIGSLTAKVAKSVGMDDVAEIWSRGKLLSDAPWYSPTFNFPSFIVFTDKYASDYHNQFDSLLNQLTPNVANMVIMSKGIDSLGWNKDDGHRWALIAGDGRVLAQDSKIPSLDEMQGIYDRFIEKDKFGLPKKYLATHTGLPGLEMEMAFRIAGENRGFDKPQEKEQEKTQMLDDLLDEAIWGNLTRCLKNVLSDYPQVLVNLPHGFYSDDSSMRSTLLKPLSKPMLTNIEPLLKRKPSSDNLWRSWLFWSSIEASERQLGNLIDNIKLSPITKIGAVPPTFVVDHYYEECKKNGSWPKVIGLLKTAWDREFQRASDDVSIISPLGLGLDKTSLGDKLGIPLIEAYLQDNKPREADVIFNAVLNCGGKFSSVASITQLALEKGYEKLAMEWEQKSVTTPKMP